MDATRSIRRGRDNALSYPEGRQAWAELSHYVRKHGGHSISLDDAKRIMEEVLASHGRKLALPDWVRLRVNLRWKLARLIM